MTIVDTGSRRLSAAELAVVSVVCIRYSTFFNSHVGEHLLGEEKVFSEGMKSLPCSAINHLKSNLNF